jgi:glycosyltransferase involved in cell wall biosynthesis
MIRSFDSKKYATDIATESILHLSRHQAFSQFDFSIYGRGHLFAETAAKLRKFRNVHMHETFLPQRSIPALHAEHGVMLCPTRQDTHGVSMCEAMASGLVPLTSRNTAIPEYVTDGVSGILTRSPRQLARAMLQLYEQPDLFVNMSRNAAEVVRRQCGLDSVILREFEIIEDTVSRVERRGETDRCALSLS